MGTHDQIHFLGVDGGGSKTSAVVVNSAGDVCARGEGGPSNHQSIGVAAAEEGVRTAVEAACSSAGHVSLVHACWGMAGLDREEDARILQAMADRLTPGVPTRMVHDATIALAGGTGGKREGVVLIAGTGSVFVGWHPDGRTARAGGWGHRLGDEGSGHAIALEGLRRATLAIDGRGAESILPQAFARATGVATFTELVNRIYLETWTAPQVAALAPVVVQAASEGDCVGQEVLSHAARELAHGAAVVIQKLGLEEDAFEVILSGGVFQSAERIRTQVQNLIHQTAPQADVRLPRAEPVIGAALLARHFHSR